MPYRKEYRLQSIFIAAGSHFVRLKFSKQVAEGTISSPISAFVSPVIKRMRERGFLLSVYFPLSKFHAHICSNVSAYCSIGQYLYCCR